MDNRLIFLYHHVFVMSEGGTQEGRFRVRTGLQAGRELG
jgi:hypothetical protein